jgi:hypothetical protein
LDPCPHRSFFDARTSRVPRKRDQSLEIGHPHSGAD